MLEHALVIGALLLGVAFILVGDALAIGLVVWSCVHMRRRPTWYVAKILARRR